MKLIHTESPTYKRAINRVHRKEQIIGELIDGRIQLSEATDQFQQMEMPLGEGSTSPSREAVCQQVLGWVALQLKDQPELADQVLARLEQQVSSRCA